MTQVLLGSTVAMGLVVVSAAKLTVVSPAHSTGVMNERVVAPAGKSDAVAADQFTYKVVPPKVSGVSPTAGPTAGGTAVTVTGSGFTGATQVLFGSTVATHLVVCVGYGGYGDLAGAFGRCHECAGGHAGWQERRGGR